VVLVEERLDPVAGGSIKRVPDKAEGPYVAITVIEFSPAERRDRLPEGHPSPCQRLTFWTGVERQTCRVGGGFFLNQNDAGGNLQATLPLRAAAARADVRLEPKPGVLAIQTPTLEKLIRRPVPMMK